MRRFTRLTNGFSKKFENHVWMVALYTVWYNFVKQHKTLKGTFSRNGGRTERQTMVDDRSCRNDRCKPAKTGQARSHTNQEPQLSGRRGNLLARHLPMRK